MKNFISALALATIVFSSPLNAQTVTGLDGFSIFLDPGHSQTENMGLYNYSEAEKVLRVGLALREMLLTQTDIDTVYMSRTNDSQQVSLSQRTDLANSLAPDFYHSIHSNAGSNTTNNTLFLHGGWRSNGQTVEKTPNGGKEMGDIMEVELTDAMRIPTIGNWADRNFYLGGSVQNHANQYPYLHVNRTTNMASVLSEAGFHTNPTQQKRNLNSDWKRLEAQSFFWSVLEYLDAERPPVGIAAGYITNADNGLPINGATISIGDSTYTTDTFESLFSNYVTNEGELQNGFYYMEGLENGPAQVIVEAEGFYTETVDTNIISTDFTFTDVALISNVPPIISSTSVGTDNEINPGEDLVINFSRSMNKDSVVNALSFTPEVEYSLSWNSAGDELSVTTDNFDFESNYTLKIDSTAVDNSTYAHNLDGDSDGTQGDSYVLDFETGPVDIIPPAISGIRPTNTQLNELRPIISATFDEHLDTTLFDDTTIEVSKSDYTVPGQTVYYTVGDRSVLNFFPSERLDKSRNYTLSFSKSISDTAGNSLGSDVVRTFPTGDQDIVNEISIDDFEGGISSWWEPSQSGSTDGYVAEETNVEISSDMVNLLTNSSEAMRVNYGWDTTSTANLIREYRSSTTPTFANNLVVQAYVFGDGSGNKFRFMVRDANGQLEGSTWYDVNWLGWKLVSWNLAEDEIVPWANGNGDLNGDLYIDSFQLTYTEGSPTTGFIVFDDLRAVEMGLATSNEDDPVAADIPKQFELKQNYPNPFNPSTNISFGLPERSEVTLKVYDMLGREVSTVYSGIKSQGFHTIQFDASALSSGVYLYRINSDFGSISKKMTLLK
ncbi:N-acetylmuramoyl-L-alanine amidase [Gracilimonas sp.]|uniref:N-acetylmuramoyl-L-alanine amidase n=1 Tax=Gracilimonas sp. TaxID=1974203 RepID=UPI0032EC04AD